MCYYNHAYGLVISLEDYNCLWTEGQLLTLDILVWFCTRNFNKPIEVLMSCRMYKTIYSSLKWSEYLGVLQCIAFIHQISLIMVMFLQVNSVNGDFNTPLITVMFLWVNSLNDDFNTPLISIMFLRLIIGMFLQVNSLNDDFNTPLIMAVFLQVNGLNDDFNTPLITAVFLQVNSLNDDFNTPLIMAMFLQVNSLDDDFNTPLIMAYVFTGEQPE